ncbi:hypothetical protein [Photobacterium nomapromontoriensis]|uniref:hypothetical protein n=1 Tax=Photobacterium nomapromontoriensis TaxID=2910237 RepID=UPI003D09CB57
MITIHPNNANSMTDYDKLSILSKHYPSSSRYAQDLLVSTSKLIKKEGLFSTETSRMKNVMKTYESLIYALNDEFMDNFDIDMNNREQKQEVAFQFLSIFSEIAPNWQEEYDTLNHLIPHF